MHPKLIFFALAATKKSVVSYGKKQEKKQFIDETKSPVIFVVRVEKLFETWRTYVHFSAWLLKV